MVKIVVSNIYSRIVGFLPPEVHTDLRDALSFRVLGAKHMKAVKEGRWDGYIRLYYKAKGQSFYTGLYSLVKDILKKHNVDYQVEDKRIVPGQNLPDLKFIPPPNYQERDYQEMTIDRSIKYTRGILSLSTGAGKTILVAKLISQIKTGPFLFYVLTKDLMVQAYDVLSTCLNEPIGMIGDGKCDIKNINVCTIQTVIRALNVKNSSFKINDYQFDEEDVWNEEVITDVNKIEAIQSLVKRAKGIYMDEAHHTSAKTVTETLEASFDAYWRFGGSATPNRDSGDEILIQAMFGAKIVDIDASYLIKRGFLIKPYIFFVPINSNAGYHSYAKVYKYSVVENNAFNDSVAQTVNHLVSRGLSVLILVQQYKHGEYLKERIPNCEFVTSKLTTAKRTECLNELRNRKKMALIATSLADEGLDIVSLDAVILAGGGASSTRIKQRIGRTLRCDKSSNKDKSIVIAYEHDAKYLCKHAQKIRGLLKKEKEFVLYDSNGKDYICSEIDKLLGLKSDEQNLFT